MEYVVGIVDARGFCHGEYNFCRELKRARNQKNNWGNFLQLVLYTVEIGPEQVTLLLSRINLESTEPRRKNEFGHLPTDVYITIISGIKSP